MRVLDRLHAKVLIVDEEYAFFGSQNFTNYSTGSIEITTQIDSTDDFDEFFEYFSELLSSARLMTIEELNEAAGSTRFITADEDEDEDD